MKYLIAIVLIFVTSTTLMAQGVTVTPVQEHSGNDVNTYPTKSGTISISNNQFVLGATQIVQPAAWSVSGQKNKLAFLEKREVLYLRSFEDTGIELFETDLDFFDPDDPTLNVYQLSDGRVAIRDNVANFSFMDSRGGRMYTVSNSSRSVDGERESQLATDRYGRTVVLYNPVIAYGNQTGSRAQFVFGDQQTEVFFNDDRREIKSLTVDDDGLFITLIATNGGSDEVFVYDRFGNKIFDIEAEDELVGADLTRYGDFLTLFTGSRMQVYRVSNGELLGSASSRSSIISAAYMPDDEIVIALGGSVNNGRISNPSITAVHLSLRQIIREDVTASLSFLESDQVRFRRSDENRYRITGLNQDLNLSLRF